MSKLRVNEITDLNDNLLWSASEGVGGASVSTASGDQTLNEALQSRVIYVDTIADLQALDTSGLVDGQLVDVRGTQYAWAASEQAWSILGAVSVLTYGAIQDAGVDSTQQVIDAAVAAGPRGLVKIPPNVKYDFNALMDSADVPVSVSFLDESLINGSYANAKRYGLYEKGDSSSVADQTFVLSSGHQPSFNLENTGAAGSSSSNNRVANISWGGARSRKGANPGSSSPIARLEFAGGGQIGDNRWGLTLRKRAPWEAARSDYFRWAEGTSVNVGEVCFSPNRYYRATTSGITGASAPSHASGTASDGGVEWERIPFGYDGSVYKIDDLGRSCTNTASPGNKFRLDRMSPDDDESDGMRYVHEAVGVSKNVIYIARPTDNAGVSHEAPELHWTPGELSVRFGGVILLTFAEGYVGHAVRNHVTGTGSGTTMSVANRSSLIVDNQTPTDLSDLTGYTDNQEVQLVFKNANTTVKHGSGIVLEGGVDVTPTGLSVMTLRRSSITNNWIEVSRSIK